MLPCIDLQLWHRETVKNQNGLFLAVSLPTSLSSTERPTASQTLQPALETALPRASFGSSRILCSHGGVRAPEAICLGPPSKVSS